MLFQMNRFPQELVLVVSTYVLEIGFNLPKY